MSSTPASGGATSRGAALPPPVPVVPIGPAASHRVLFRAWADAADLEPLAVPRIGDRRRPEPPWQFLRPFTGSASIDPSEIRSPREDGKERLSLHLTVLMGITDTRALLDSINHRLDADPDRERSTIPAGNCFSCSVEVDMATSLPRPDSMVQSRLVLLARRGGA
ncbi:MAG: hypothetical protein ABW219_08140, partial [Ilumatobacteraceae bacterium]